MNNSNSINTPLHVVNFVASLPNFANDRNLIFRGGYRFTFSELTPRELTLRLDYLVLGNRKTTTEKYIWQPRNLG